MSSSGSSIVAKAVVSRQILVWGSFEVIRNAWRCFIEVFAYYSKIKVVFERRALVLFYHDSYKQLRNQL